MPFQASCNSSEDKVICREFADDVTNLDGVTAVTITDKHAGSLRGDIKIIETLRTAPDLDPVMIGRNWN